MNYKKLLVEKPIKCEMCGEELKLGDIMYYDEDRGNTPCGYCKDDYEDEIIKEGEDGRFLK